MSRRAEHTCLAMTGDGAAPATKRKREMDLTSRGLSRLRTVECFMTLKAVTEVTKLIQRPYRAALSLLSGDAVTMVHVGTLLHTRSSLLLHQRSVPLREHDSLALSPLALICRLTQRYFQVGAWRLAFRPLAFEACSPLRPPPRRCWRR